MHPIVLIHGFPLDSAMWRAQTDFLRSPQGGGHNVLTPDLPGFGSAPATAALAQDQASIEGYAEYIHGIIESQAGGKAIVGGFSMGGYILLALLHDYPQDVAAAMFVDTRAEPDATDTRAARLKTIEDIRKNGPGTFFESMTTRLLRKKPARQVVQDVRAMMERQSPAAIMAAQTAMAKRHDQNDLLSELKIPVLVIVGAEDAITPPSVAVAMQSQMPHAMLVQIVSAGHLTPVEQPDAVNAALRAFLATVKE